MAQVGRISVKDNGIAEISKSNMANVKIKWLIYTVLVGLIPVFLRLLIWSVLQHRTMDFLNAADFVAFGLILHISNINEIEHLNDPKKSWKTMHNGISIVFIVLYGGLFTCSLFDQSNPGLIDARAIKYAAIVLSLTSFGISYSIYHKISKSRPSI